MAYRSSLTGRSPVSIPSASNTATNLLGHSSSVAIIITWVLTAFIPLPLIILIFILRFSPNFLFRSNLPKVSNGRHHASKPSDSSLSGDQSHSTPSSHTLTPSRRHSFTLAGRSHGPFSPSKDNVEREHAYRPEVPHGRLRGCSDKPTRPSRLDTRARLRGLANRPSLDIHDALQVHPPASHSGRRSAFLEPPKFPLSPRKNAYARLSSDDADKPSIPNPKEVLPLSSLQERRQLRGRVLASAIFLIIILASFIIEGFTIAAAQGYAHTKVLVHPDGKGGLGRGKEDERWLIPWVVYIFLQGGMALTCIGMVWNMRCELKNFDLDRKEGNSKHTTKSSHDAPRDVELQAFNTPNETDRFLSDREDDARDITESKGKGKEVNVDEEDEKVIDWKTLGYHPSFITNEVPVSSARFAKPNRTSSPERMGQDPAYHGNGEGSSRHPAFAHDSNPHPSEPEALAAPLSFPSAKTSQWWTERSQAEMELQKRSARANEQEASTAEENRSALLREELMGPPPKTPSNHNSWAQAEDEHATNPKGKETTAAIDRQQPPPPYQPSSFSSSSSIPDLPTGIDLNTDYHFTDGLAYPLLPLPPSSRRKPQPPHEPHYPPPPPHHPQQQAQPHFSTPPPTPTTPSLRPTLISTTTSAAPKPHPRIPFLTPPSSPFFFSSSSPTSPSSVNTITPSASSLQESAYDYTRPLPLSSPFPPLTPPAPPAPPARLLPAISPQRHKPQPLVRVPTTTSSPRRVGGGLGRKNTIGRSAGKRGSYHRLLMGTRTGLGTVDEGEAGGGVGGWGGSEEGE
ncbi:MAG: hypothetical protein Q9220_004732 [cf. Caloplaca sp. 1 TL-2023]